MPKDGGGHSGYHPSPSLDSLSISSPLHHFPRSVLMSPSDHRYVCSISQHPSFAFNHLSALFVLLFSCTYSIFSLVSPSPSLSLLLGKLLCYLITLTVQDGVCVCVCLSLSDMCKDLALIQPATHMGTSNGGRKDKCSPRKTKLNTVFFFFFLWSIAATGADSVIAPP